MLCEKLGIKHELSTSYSPQQNGVVERKNRTLVEKVRSMLNFRQLPISFSAEAIVAATYLSNISPTPLVPDKTPHEAWFGVKPKMSHVKIFGFIAYTHVLSQNVEKLDSRDLTCIFIGYFLKSKAI